ncbi:MAG TPA: ATP-binding protein [Vicinamibacterales bacterium]|nr:ATP-binding protein [Vicinamibacterales bacterium]
MRVRAVLLLAAVFALALWAELSLHRSANGFAFIAFAPAVAIAAWVSGATPALAMILASALASDFFLLGPGRLFHFDSRLEVLAFITFIGGWSAMAVFVAAVRGDIEREGARRIVAEHASAQAHRLAQSTGAFAQVRTSEEAMNAALHEPLHWLDAAGGVLFLLSEDRQRVTVARTAGYRLDDRDSWGLDELGEGSPFAEAMQRLTPVVIQSPPGQQPAYAVWSSAGPWSGHEASLVLPIAIERRVVAFLQIDFDSPREFSADDHEYIQMLCTRAGQALHRTWWHETVERARFDAESLKERADAELVERQKTELALRSSETRYRALATRTTRLHALTASLSEAASVTAVTNAIVEQAPIVVGAHEGDLRLVEDRGVEFEPGLCATEAMKSRKPVFVGSVAESQEQYWRSASLAADKGFASAAALPLLVKGNPIGVLEFHFSAPVNFDDEYQTLLISVAQHCTQALDRAYLYEQAERARAEAEAANRLKDEFVSTVSHELRTPLNAILGWAAMLRTDSIDPDVVPQALEAIHRNASRQARLVDDLLDFSRLSGGRTALDLELVDAPALIRGVVESVVPLAASNQIEIEVSSIPDAKLPGDVRRLEQVFVNLLGNSLKFTPTGGHIVVSARIADRNLEVRVADDGIGIEPSFLPYVFDRFRQGDSTSTRNHPGLGLGLSIARQLVDAHGGSIRAESGGTGKGTAFIVTLPIDTHAGANTPAPPPEQLDTEPRLDGIRVLVVDDERDARELIGRALEDRGAEISLADNSSDAIRILERDDIDVLLADIAMPDEDGYALIRRIRASPADRMAGIPAAAVTAHAHADERLRALAAGFQVHVPKPVEPFELVRTVSHLAHDGRVGRRAGV